MEDQNAEIRVVKKPEQVRALLCEMYPKCFKARGELKLPLAIGIHKMIKARNPGVFSNSELTRGLANYINGPKYLGQMHIGATRVDLDGWHVDTVTPAQAAWAHGRLAKLQQTWQAKAIMKNRKKALAALKAA